MRYKYLALFAFLYVLPIVSAEKPIVVIIPSYNNRQWYRPNLDSVFCQKYNNYRVIYINDRSSDGTGELVGEYIQQAGMADRFTFINNTERHGALANLYRAIHSCDNNEIIITCDGDDWFETDQVLARVNQAYQDDMIWLTYGQFKIHPQGTTGFCREMPAGVAQGNLFREYDWITSHPRTFYAALFKKVSLKDLLYEGDFLDVTWDMAFMYPMLEMSVGHFAFISDTLYVYNQSNSLNDFRQKLARQIRCKYYVSSKDKYSRIAALDIPDDRAVELFILSDKTPEQLSSCFVQLERYLDGVDAVTVLYRANDHTRSAYQKLQRKHCYVKFLEVDSFAQNLDKALLFVESPFVLITDDAVTVQASCNVRICAQVLQQTDAHAFYLSLGKDCEQHMPPMVNVIGDVYAWQFKYAEFAFKRPFNIQMTLYKKEVIKSAVEKVQCAELKQLPQALNDIQFDYEHVGLCFEHSRVKGEWCHA